MNTTSSRPASDLHPADGASSSPLSAEVGSISDVEHVVRLSPDERVCRCGRPATTDIAPGGRWTCADCAFDAIGGE